MLTDFTFHRPPFRVKEQQLSRLLSIDDTKKQCDLYEKCRHTCPTNSVTGVYQKEKSMAAEYKYPSDYSDETGSDFDVTWSPGDGVCPSTAQFNDCFQSKLDDWRCASSTSLEDSNPFPFYINAFLDLLKKVPSFFQCPPVTIEIIGRPKTFLMLRSSVHIKTTEDLGCSQPQKSIDYMHCVGSPVPAIYKPKAEAKLQAVFPLGTKTFRFVSFWIFHKHCSSLVVHYFLPLGGNISSSWREK